MKRILILAAILAFSLLPEAMATKFAPPTDRTVKSPNCEFPLEVHADGRHKIRKGGELLWSFKRSIWHDEFCLSNDGQRVLFAAWGHVQTDGENVWVNRQAADGEGDDAIVVYSPDGVVMKKAFGEVSQPLAGPEGWRKGGGGKRGADAVFLTSGF